MPAPKLLTEYNDSAQAWEQALMAFLAEKQRRSVRWSPGAAGSR